MIADTSFVVALMIADDDFHHLAREWLEAYPGRLETTPLALTEMDHIIRRRGGVAGRGALRAQAAAGSLAAEIWPAMISDTLAVAAGDRDLSLADASLVALAAHLGTIEIATFDLRDFRRLRPLTGEPAFRLLPADAG